VPITAGTYAMSFLKYSDNGVGTDFFDILILLHIYIVKICNKVFILKFIAYK